MSNTYREAGDEDDDLDDLDDVLASFDKPIGANAGPSKRKAPETSPPIASSSLRPLSDPVVRSAPIAVEAEENDEDFEASLVEGMESLLRQLAGEHPPGPMPDTPQSKSQTSNNGKGKAAVMTEEEEEAAWEKAVQELLSGDGLEALGIPKDGGKGKAARGGPGAGEKASFDETIRRTMESLNSTKRSTGQGEDGKDLAALLKALQSDPSALDGLDGLGDDDDLGGLLDGMMSQLMTREVLEEPMAELATKYPGYLEAPPAGVPPADLDKYRRQKALVDQILAVFRKADYEDEKDGKEIARLVGEMQDLGGPPQEIMGEMPEGFDLSALGEEGCTIM